MIVCISGPIQEMAVYYHECIEMKPKRRFGNKVKDLGSYPEKTNKSVRRRLDIIMIY